MGKYCNASWKDFRYAVQWESKNLIAVSSAIQDWLKSSKLLDLNGFFGAISLSDVSGCPQDLQGS